MVVVLDDDILAHEIWKKCFKQYKDDLTFKYFTKGIETINFLNSIQNKSQVFLISDYELKGEPVNGMYIIEKSQMQERHLLVTNKYLSDIKNFKNKSDFLKIFHKMYLNDISINVN
jgi:5S rRNA maturation endonuclease (ribonuclease M5)